MSQDTIRRQLQKLRTMAERGATAAERLTAAALARRLCRRHGLDPEPDVEAQHTMPAQPVWVEVLADVVWHHLGGSRPTYGADDRPTYCGSTAQIFAFIAHCRNLQEAIHCLCRGTPYHEAEAEACALGMVASVQARLHARRPQGEVVPRGINPAQAWRDAYLRQPTPGPHALEDLTTNPAYTAGHKLGRNISLCELHVAAQRLTANRQGSRSAPRRKKDRV